ncbi:MAG: AEC family transporter [Pseudomonadota bacterium]
MTIVITVTLPVFAIIFAGWLAGRTGLLGRDGSVALNQFVYAFALPALLIVSLTEAPLAEIINLPFLAAFAGGVAIVYTIAALTAMIRRQPGQAIAMQGLNASFANTGYMGIPLFIALVGESSLAPVIIATVFMSSVMIAVGVATLEAFTGGGKSVLIIARDIALALVKNPLLIASAIGITLALIQVVLPEPIERFCRLLGAAAGPCALFAIGLFLAGQKLTEGLGEAIWLSVLKLLVQPLATWWLIVQFIPLEPFWQASALVLAALPTGALTFVVAQRYNAHVGATSAVIFVSTLISIISLSILLIYLAPVFQQAMTG